MRSLMSYSQALDASTESVEHTCLCRGRCGDVDMCCTYLFSACFTANKAMRLPCADSTWPAATWTPRWRATLQSTALTTGASAGTRMATA